MLGKMCGFIKWDKEGTISKVRTNYDNKTVSYELELNGSIAIRHRRNLHKKNVDETALQNDEPALSTSYERAAADQGPRRSSRQAARQHETCFRGATFSLSTGSH